MQAKSPWSTNVETGPMNLTFLKSPNQLEEEQGLEFKVSRLVANKQVN